MPETKSTPQPKTTLVAIFRVPIRHRVDRERARADSPAHFFDSAARAATESDRVNNRFLEGSLPSPDSTARFRRRRDCRRPPHQGLLRSHLRGQPRSSVHDFATCSFFCGRNTQFCLFECSIVQRTARRRSEGSRFSEATMRSLEPCNAPQIRLPW